MNSRVFEAHDHSGEPARLTLASSLSSLTMPSYLGSRELALAPGAEAASGREFLQAAN